MAEDKENRLNEDSSSKNNGHSVKGWLSSIFFILFLINIWKFLNSDGSEIPILSLLFNMIIYLGIIMFINHKNEVTFGYDKFIGSQIDK